MTTNEITTKQDAIAEVHYSFRNWVKWETYGLAFGLMDKGLITLKQIKEIALMEAGINPSVVAMRRKQFLKMAK